MIDTFEITSEVPIIAKTFDGLVNHGPNPVVDFATFYFKLPEGTTGATLYIFDVAGTLVDRQEILAPGLPMTFDARKLPNGLYLYAVITDGGKRSDVKSLVVWR
ncbi:MAG: T9SS type A sorting domain-containing protein [Candidatus Bipolaricaulia bacterium]